MADPLDYAAEKFHVALHFLVKDGVPKRRLYNAYMSFYPVKEDDFKARPELRDQYKEIIDALTSKPARNDNEGIVNSTLDQMSDEEAQRIINLIVDLTLSIDAQR